jgi:hypothetical protein
VSLTFGSTAGLPARRSAAPGPSWWGGVVGSPLSAPVVSAVLAIVTALLGWRGADTANHLFRIELFRRAGFTIWDSAWYGGHFLPGYSVLLGPLGALLGPRGLGFISVVVAATCFDRILRARLGARCAAASLLFAASTVTNLVVGRLAFALGLALALAALLAADRHHPVLTGGLSVATALASPVAACFLTIAWLGQGLSRRTPFSWRRPLPARKAILVALTAAPVAVIAIAFPDGGDFPFRWSALVLVLVTCLAALVLLPTRARELRWAAVVYGTLALVVFVVPNPLGANLTRLGMYALAPLLVAFAPRRRLVWALLPLLLWWQWSPAIDGIFRSGSDPSVKPEYYQPLVHYLQTRPGVERIEIPLTERHFEVAYVAPVVPLARGGERQIDRKVNEVLYSPTLTAAQYRDWLETNGVELVALPDAALDSSATAEAQLLRHGQPYLRPVWAGQHWRVWELVGAPGLVSGPARLVDEGAESVVLDATGRGAVVVRVRWSTYWSVDGPACARAGGDGWVHLEVRAAGRLVLHQVILGSRTQCDDDGHGI